MKQIDPQNLRDLAKRKYEKAIAIAEEQYRSDSAAIELLMKDFPQFFGLGTDEEKEPYKEKWQGTIPMQVNDALDKVPLFFTRETIRKNLICDIPPVNIEAYLKRLSDKHSKVIRLKRRCGDQPALYRKLGDYRSYQYKSQINP